MEKLNVVSAPKTCSFQKSLNVGGMSFLISEENEKDLRSKAYRRLIQEIEKGEVSGSVDEDEALRRLGLER